MDVPNDSQGDPMFATIRRFVAAALLVTLPVTALAGAVGGPKYSSTQVLAGATDTFEVSFAAGELATVMISGDGDTDLDLYVYDENGNLVASDTGSSDTATVSWTPAWTGNFRVQVRNLGNVYNSYVVMTN
jgi:hypothetical protein